MQATLKQVWRFTIFRGILALIFGATALLWPNITLQALILLFAAFVFVDGITTIAAGIRDRGQKKWWLQFIEGFLGIGAGIIALIWPALTAVIFVFIVAAWAISTGIMEILAAVQLRKMIENEWLLALSGFLSILFGALLFLSPNGGLLAIIWITGIYALLFGITLILLGNKIRRLQENNAPLTIQPTN